MTAGGLRYDRYTLAGSEEWMVRIGQADRPCLLFLPPLFEEMNRTRALIVGVMRRLAGRGWKCLLPDLPGTGESERAIESCSWEDWRAAVRAAAPTDLAGIVSLRGGCVLDDATGTPCLWRLSPVDGAGVVRDLQRASRVSDGASAGYAPSPALLDRLAIVRPAQHRRLRTVRLASDRGQADRKIDHPPPWRRSEPQSSSELGSAIASDIDEWVRKCAAS